ncbi:hypothetical protein MASR2M15_06640 [Anaerolineales bacterium]
MAHTALAQWDTFALINTRDVLMRSGPDRQFPPVHSLTIGDEVLLIGRVNNAAWIFVAYEDNLGWISPNFINWEGNVLTLPILDLAALTQTPLILTPSTTPTLTLTPTLTATATSTATATNTATATATATTTLTPTLTPSSTATLTVTASATATITPTTKAAATITPTFTLTPTETRSITLTQPPTLTLQSTLTKQVGVIPTVTDEKVLVLPLDASSSPSPTLLPPSPDSDSPSVKNIDTNLLPLEMILGLIFIGFVLIYIVFYLFSSIISNRFNAGFPIQPCPVCHSGKLSVEAKHSHFLGIPRSRHIVRCNHCRSVLREVATNKWRYAVDPFVNPALSERFNNQEISMDTLQDLSKANPKKTRTNIEPAFIENETESDK